MVIKSLIMIMLVSWGLLALRQVQGRLLWPALRGRQYQPLRVPARANRRPGGDTW